MNYPTNWNQVKVDQWIEYIELEKESFDSFFDYEIEVFQILMDDMFENDIDDFSVNEFDAIRKQFNFRLNEPTKKINYNIGPYKYKGIDSLTFGEFIDMEYYVTNGLFKHLPNICAIMWRRTKLDEWGNEIIEPYANIDLNKRVEEFKLVPITDVYGVIEEYTKQKELIIDTFTSIFEQPIPDDGQFDDYLTEEDRRELEKEEMMANFSWEMVLYEVADGDITKYDAILGLPLIFVLNYLSLKKGLKST